jgi:hypothetical protein
MAYTHTPVWDVEYTDEFGLWWQTLALGEQASIAVAVEALEQRGPALGRPFVDNVKTSRHPNMKELRPRGETIRILFAFDPRRVALLLVGGDKRDRWADWYQQTVPVADDLYDQHLGALRREGDAT